MANTNRRWYIVATIILVGVIVLIIVHLSTGESNSVTNSGKITKIIPNGIIYESTPGIIDVNNQRIWPITLPKPPHCGIASTMDKIIGGRVVEFDEQPWTALLKFRHGNRITNDCGGTLINHEYVITAANCLANSRDKLIGVLLGEQDLYNDYDCLSTEPDECANDKPVLYTIAKILIHPQFNHKTITNDIALIKLNATVKFNEITKPICLPDDDYYMRDLSKPAFAIGWGLTNGSDRSSESRVKKIVDLPVWDRVRCAQKMHTIETQICAGGEEGKDACTYDMGGPLVRLAHMIPPTWFLEGIASYGFKGACGVKGYPGVYTNVSAHMDWILGSITR